MTGTVLNSRYRLDKELGSGGFATVYAGYDLQKGQQVAVKVTNDLISRNTEQLKAFLDELNALARLPQHPNVIGILDYGVVGEKTFLVMEYAPYGTLEGLLQAAAPDPLDFSLACRFFEQMAQALAHAHAHSVVHRDIKPENMLFIAHDRLVISDFGLARRFNSHMTQSINLFGSPPYVAPERWSDKVGPASDVYALGIILYQMLTGSLPFHASDPLAYLQLHVYNPAPRLRHKRPDLPAGLDELLHAMLAKQPDERPDSSELALLFKRALQEATGYYQISRAKPAPTNNGFSPAKPAPTSSNPHPSSFIPHPSSGPVRMSGRLALGAETLPPAPADNAPEVQYWTEAIHSKVGVPENFVKRARAYLTTQTHYKAIADYTEALKLDGRNPQVYFERGKAFMEARQYEDAIADYNRTVKLAPQFPDAYEQRANTFLALGQFSQAIMDYEAAMRFNSQNSEIYNKRTIAYKQRAETLYNDSRYREALADYNQAIALNPGDARLYKERANVYYALNKYRRAVADYARAIRLGLKHAEVFIQLGNVYMGMRQYRNAIQQYTQALKLPGWNVEVYKNRAYAYLCLKRYRQALADYNEALKLTPNDAEVFFQRGHVYFANRDYQKALADYDEALRLDPSNLTPLYHRAMTLAALGRVAEALQTLRYQLSQTKDRRPKKLLIQAITHLENLTGKIPLRGTGSSFRF